MSVWYAIPSKRPIEEAETVIKLWRERGYKIALWRDEDWPDDLLKADLPVFKPTTLVGYIGYARVVNCLVSTILHDDSDAQWIVTGGDDVEPDPNKTAVEISFECSQYFWRLHNEQKETFGVMQPTGDPWEDDSGRIIERICGSPWMGREFCERINKGNGPLWPEYTHCFVDEELQCVARKYGLFQQRPDLVQTHNHFSRDARGMPEFHREASSEAHWRKYSTIFRERKAAGFPGSEPL